MPARHCLLVVDDEPEVVQSLKDLLRFDYRVLGATRAADALRLVDQEPVDVVMSDQRMPDMNGVEFLRRLRQSHPDIVRLLFTGYADIRAVIAAINEGHVFRYITKPWDVDELLTVLRQAAERRDLMLERQQLLAELQEKNRRLETMNAELQQAVELKEAFIRVASHELRTPLTIVLGLADLARRTESVGEPLRSWLEQIYGGSQRLNALVEQLTKLLAAGQFERPLELEDTSVVDLVQGAADDVMPFVLRRKQRLTIEAPAEPFKVRVEPGKIRDAVAHLLLNAIKFTPDGGLITLGVRGRPEGGAQIQVRDHGEGMDEATLAQLGQPFFTSFDVSRHSSGVFEFQRRGLGLGLTLVRAFVEMHGGHLIATSRRGEGTTMTIVLPASPGTSPQSGKRS